MTAQTQATGRFAIPRGEGLVRLSLNLDAAVTGANGVAYLAAADALDGVLGVPAGFLRALGAFLVAFAALAAYTGTRERVSRSAVLGIVAVNVLWVIDSVTFAILDLHTPDTAGMIWTIVQALTVAQFAALQYYAVTRG